MSKNPLKDEKEILRELAGGSESAFARVFNHFSPRVYSTSLRFLGSEESAQEVVQDVFMDIWLRREKLTGVLNLEAYLQGMVRKQVYDVFRMKSAFEELQQELLRRDYAENSTERLLRDREYQVVLTRTLESLPDLQREIFRLAKEDGLSHQDIAHRMNLSPLAVKAHMKRSLRFIRMRLEPFLSAEPLLAILVFLGIR
ncbi:RNA polymerase sigma-70 factor [Ravibacter arvi]|uniref:RNA polymerase sigma-70 factor n=1 Tax=Ravibacter arvi TaxID=2051041 RepID=A0ABP8LV32_9BACT